MPDAFPPLTARALWSAELRAGRRTRATADALSRAACCDAHADECSRDAGACLARAERATLPSEAVRFARCALTFDRSAAVWRDRAAAHLAGNGAAVGRAA